MTVNELCKTMSLSPIALPDGERSVSGAYIGDLLSWVMGRAESGNAWVTIMSNINIVAVASLSDVACVLLAEGVTVEENVRRTAEEKGINLLSSDRTAYALAKELARLGI